MHMTYTFILHSIRSMRDAASIIPLKQKKRKTQQKDK